MYALECSRPRVYTRTFRRPSSMRRTSVLTSFSPSSVWSMTSRDSPTSLAARPAWHPRPSGRVAPRRPQRPPPASGNPRPSALSSHLLRLQQKANAPQDLTNALGGKRPDPISQLFFVEGEYLGNVDDALTRQVGFPIFKQHIAGVHCTSQVRGQAAGYGRVYAALVEE